MKRILLILFVFSLKPFVFGQSLSLDLKKECATTLPANYGKWRNTVIQNNVSTLKHNICVNKKFSIVFYVIADTNGNNPVSAGTLGACINALNNAFAPICVTFMNCSTVVIPHHPFNRWTSDTIDPICRAMYNTANTINIYMPDSIVGPPAGYSPMPGGPTANGIVIEKNSIVGSVTIHEMGHFFGLPHTWDEIGGAAVPPPPPGVGSQEFVRRTNCYTNGDGFCDTEADCYPVDRVITAPCQHQFGAKDGYLDYYTPPVDNYMTYFKCGCRFTQEQRNFMANTALTQLMSLH